MKRLLATTAIVCGALWFHPQTAHANYIDPLTGIEYIDPTAFHVTATGATGSDPVLLNNKTAFSIQDNGGQNIDKPLTIFIAGPIGSVAPVIATVNYDNGAITPIAGPFTRTLVGNDTALTDLYTFVGCVACDGSLNFSNIDAAYAADSLAKPTGGLTVWSFSVNQDFVGKDGVDVTGTFANGDIVFPFAQNVGDKKVTIFDTSWTNAGFVNCTTGCSITPPPPPPPPPPPVDADEPYSIALLGFGLLGTLAFRRRQRR
jgi:MYXO-CTERM domain-containing protein